jgi:hypothetical protein
MADKANDTTSPKPTATNGTNGASGLEEKLQSTKITNDPKSPTTNPPEEQEANAGKPLLEITRTS